jgi:hypothetical protein
VRQLGWKNGGDELVQHRRFRVQPAMFGPISRGLKIMKSLWALSIALTLSI